MRYYANAAILYAESLCYSEEREEPVRQFFFQFLLLNNLPGAVPETNTLLLSNSTLLLTILSTRLETESSIFAETKSSALRKLPELSDKGNDFSTSHERYMDTRVST